MTELMYKCLF
jgi:hypothetical protein